MHILTDDELRRDPARLLEDARRGQVTVVTTDGQPLLMTVPLDKGAPAHGALLNLAAALSERERISLGRAAEIAGLAPVDMIDELARRGVATLRLQAGEPAREPTDFGR